MAIHDNEAQNGRSKVKLPYLSPAYQRKHSQSRQPFVVKESSTFNLRTYNASLPAYEPLNDPNLKNFFGRTNIKKQLQVIAKHSSNLKTLPAGRKEQNSNNHQQMNNTQKTKKNGKLRGKNKSINQKNLMSKTKTVIPNKHSVSTLSSISKQQFNQYISGIRNNLLNAQKNNKSVRNESIREEENKSAMEEIKMERSKDNEEEILEEI